MPSLNIRSHDAPMNSSFIMQLCLFTGSVLYGFIRHGLAIIFCYLSVFMNSQGRQKWSDHSDLGWTKNFDICGQSLTFSKFWSD